MEGTQSNPGGVCWVCCRLLYSGAPMECGHCVCWCCMVSLCTTAYFSWGSEQKPNREDGIVNIECRVCHHKTSLCIWDVMAEAGVDGCPTYKPQHELGDSSGLQRRCVFHHDRPVERYCVTDKLPMCLECALAHHSTHELAEGTAKELTPLMGSMVHEMGRKECHMQNSADCIDGALTTLTNRQRTIEGEITHTFTRITKEIQKRKNTLLANTAKFFESRKRTLKLELKCRQSVVSQLKGSQILLRKVGSQNCCESKESEKVQAEVLGGLNQIQTFYFSLFPHITVGTHIKTDCPPILSDVMWRTNTSAKYQVAPILKCINSLSFWESESEEEFAMRTTKLLVEGEFDSCFRNCLEMFPSSHGPIGDYRNCQTVPHSGDTPLHQMYRSYNCSDCRSITTHCDALGLILLHFIMQLHPDSLQPCRPFGRYPAEEICECLRYSRSTSQEFLEKIILRALALMPPQEEKGRASKILSLFTTTPHTDTATSGLVALAHVMRGTMMQYNHYRRSLTVSQKEYQQAISVCITASESGTATTRSLSKFLDVPRALAEYQLSNCLKDTTAKQSHLEVAAHLGNVRAQARLGEAQAGLEMLMGDTVRSLLGVTTWFRDKNEREGVKWIRKASEGGDAWGQYLMAKLYENGWADVVENGPEALRLYRLSAEQGFNVDKDTYQLVDDEFYRAH
ncbi:hypothetical protein Pelo_9508 [Pelomyxa schiedti]|nr:hypothetical protein Pelo_9508 [Pelomyxa schiedti]